MDKIEKIAIENLKNDLDKLIKKRTTKVAHLKENPFKVIIGNREYYTENALVDSYHNCLITQRQLETGIKAFADYKDNQELKVTNAEINLLCDIWEKLNGYQNKEKH